MKFQHCLPVFLATPLLVAITGQSSLAFSLTMPASQPSCSGSAPVWCSSTSYTFQGIGTTTTTLTPIVKLPLGGTERLYNLLSTSVWAKDGYQFVKSTQDLKGTLNILKYSAVAGNPNSNSSNLPTTQGGPVTFQNRRFSPLGALVGAFLELSYQAEKTEQTSEYHWIQLYDTNHGFISSIQGVLDLGYPSLQTIIDVPTEQIHKSYKDGYNPQKQTFNPYYDTYGVATSTKFFDYPRLTNFFNPNYFNLESYLVKESQNNQTKQKTVTIYNGISWGYSNKFTPCSAGSGGGGCVSLAPSPSPTPRPAPSPTPRPAPTPTPRPSPTPSPRPALSPSPTPRPAPSPTPRPAPSPTPRPAPSPTPRPAPSPSPGRGHPIQAFPSSYLRNAKALTLPQASLFESEGVDSNDYESSNLQVASDSQDLLADSELSTDSNSNDIDLPSISSDLLLDPELSSKEGNNPHALKPKNASANDNDDALPAEAVPEPTTGLGTLLALGGLGLLKKLKNRKTKE